MTTDSSPGHSVANPGFTEIGEQSAPSYLGFFLTRLSRQSQMKRLCWLYLSVENLLCKIPNASPYPRNKLSRKFHPPGYKSVDRHERFHVCTWRSKEHPAAQLTTTKNLLENTIRFQGFEQKLPSLAMLHQSLRLGAFRRCGNFPEPSKEHPRSLKGIFWLQSNY